MKNFRSVEPVDPELWIVTHVYEHIYSSAVELE